MLRKNTWKTLALAAGVVSISTPVALAQIPSHPNELTFKPLHFEPPKADEFLHTLSNGVHVYIAPSAEFPLVNIRFSFRGGRYLDPADKVGLASMTASMMRRGGTTSVSAKELDEQLDFLAANCSTFAGPIQAGANLNCLKSNLTESFGLFMDIVLHPGFDADRIKIYRDEQMESMKQRNDDAGNIMRREWRAMMNGRDHFAGRSVTEATLNAITDSDMRAFHDRIYNPANLIVAITGDVRVDDAIAMLEDAFKGWDMGERMPEPPAPTASITPGVYHIEKEIPQGKVNIGMRGVKRDNPDYYALLVMNNILGGGGFTSRIMSRVRSDEGLAYGAGSAMIMPPYYPGEFRATYASKNRTVALALKIVFEEFDKIRTQLVSDEELETAKNSYIETFPRTFESKAGTLNVFVNDEWTHRDPSFWSNYRDNFSKVTAEDVRRVAKDHIRPEEMAILVVGTWDEIYPGDLDGRASMSEFFDGQSTELPMRDPLTQKPLSDD